jgi:hypothetical protein
MVVKNLVVLVLEFPVLQDGYTDWADLTGFYGFFTVKKLGEGDICRK